MVITRVRLVVVIMVITMVTIGIVKRRTAEDHNGNSNIDNVLTYQ